MVCSHIHAEPLRERLKGLNELGVKTPINDITRRLIKVIIVYHFLSICPRLSILLISVY